MLAPNRAITALFQIITALYNSNRWQDKLEMTDLLTMGFIHD